MSNVIVTGGAGFIGSHVADMLLACGHNVHVFDNLSTGKRENIPEKAVFHEIDIRSDKLVTLIKDVCPESIVHAAAQVSVRQSMYDPPGDVDINVKGIVNLLSSCKGNNLPFMVFFSTGGAIYGEQDTFPATEDHAIRPTSIYGLSKWVAERYFDFWKREAAFHGSVLRLSNVYGPRQDPHGEAGVVAIFSQKLIAGKDAVIFGDGKQSRDFVFVGDVVEGVRLALENKVEGTFNIGTGIETNVNELYSMIAGCLGVDAKPKYEPERPGEQRRSCIDNSLAREKLSWSPKQEIQGGLCLTAEWFKQRLRA